MSIKFNGKHTGLFAAGVLFGTAGIKILSSKDAKKVYTQCTAAVLRAKKCVMDVVNTAVCEGTSVCHRTAGNEGAGERRGYLC